MISWIKKHKLICLIVFLALFLRLFRIASYMTFLGDEGRDALVWLRMLHNGKFTLIGPQTSIGNMYLGPLFYYLMFPFYVLWGTVGPSMGTALLAGATTLLLWLFGKEWFSERTGLVAAFLYAISPVAIVLSRSAWNPNIMPFFALLCIWGGWQFWQKDNFFWLAVEGLLLSVVTQSHYLGLLLFPSVGLFWILKLITLIKTKDQRLKNYFLFTILFAICYLLFTIAPLVWFDLRHNFINYKAFHLFFSERQTTVNLKLYKAIPGLWPLWQALVTGLLTGKNSLAGFWFSLVLFSFQVINFGLFFFQRKSFKNAKAYFLLLVWILSGLSGMALYKQHIYDHYFGFLFPAVFLLAGYSLERIWHFQKIGKILGVAFIGLLTFFSVKEIPLRYPPNRQLQKTEEVAQKIVSLSADEPFNLGLIAKQNYDAGYRYFLEGWGKAPVSIDAQRTSATVTDQLYVVCEEKDCQPIGHAQAEIANFGWAKVANEWSFPWGTKLFKLIKWSKN